MIEYLIGAILLIITVVIVMLIFRRRIYSRVDSLEAWKIEIMNRNVASELSKIKELNLSGETQRKFEMWRDRWERIVAKDLADIEEFLFDAEEAADGFRFPKAHKILKTISKSLENVESDIEQILGELDFLLQAGKDSEEELISVTDRIKYLRTKLLEQRHKFGSAEKYYNDALDTLENSLSEHTELVEEGEYTQAKEFIEEVSERTGRLQDEFERLPVIYQKCKIDLPEEINQLTLGINEMIAGQFRVIQYKFDEEIVKHKDSLHKCVKALENGEIDKVSDIATEIEERIAEIYQVLEREALAKNYVESQTEQYEQKIQVLANAFRKTKEEVETLKTTYFFEDEAMERFLALENSVAQLEKNVHEFTEDLANGKLTHSELREKLESGYEQLQSLENEHKAYKEKIDSLRKDERKAKEKLTVMRSRLNNVNRTLQQSNLPGVPGFIWDRIEESEKEIIKVVESLQRQPLDIAQVQDALSVADKTIEQATEEADIVIEQSYLTEQVIQYANRYRSQYPLLSAQLSEAERLFRESEYELALENAARAVEEIEPGALRRIEENQRQMKSI